MEIALCVTGSIAAIEAVKLAKELSRHGIDVKCFMSDGACEIIHPYAMEFATGNKVVLKLTGKVEHIKFAQSDLILVAPATANVISKFAYKIADNPINTLLITAFGYGNPIIMVPSMNNSMYKAIAENIDKLIAEGIVFLDPKVEEGKAKFPDIEDIVLHVLRETSESELAGKKVVVSAGATFENIDPVRGITNRSSGKMGVEIAKEAFIRGADVTLICAHVTVNVPSVITTVKVESTGEMSGMVKKLVKSHDIFFSAAAVSDFTVKNPSHNFKISSSENLQLQLERTEKIINSVKEINPEIFLVGFKAEYTISDEELINSASRRMKESGADLMVANDLGRVGAELGSDTNQVILIDSEIIKVPLSSKKEIAKIIVDRIVEKI
ncbi:MAG: bifunctional phosphopantothenoylcysteine decarboxylase/phosphopantothenate--cysteine ligase CoaBC [Euryarchaeota archaeon]|nr:bifunctional phosphopantothenoylcysteine decarboxylase/phosphopantothenate--cysteine ligase CoaBC [Euryarchaeota archaeon]